MVSHSRAGYACIHIYRDVLMPCLLPPASELAGVHAPLGRSKGSLQMGLSPCESCCFLPSSCCKSPWEDQGAHWRYPGCCLHSHTNIARTCLSWMYPPTLPASLRTHSYLVGTCWLWLWPCHGWKCFSLPGTKFHKLQILKPWGKEARVSREVRGNDSTARLGVWDLSHLAARGAEPHLVLHDRPQQED